MSIHVRMHGFLKPLKLTKRLPMERFLVFFLLIFAVTFGRAQDNLVYLESETKTISTHNLSISDGKIEFEPIDEEGVTIEMNIGNVKEVTFNQKKPDEILIQKANLKHQKCYIDEINKKHVKYHLTNAKSEQIESKRVFYISFLGSAPVPEINEYEKSFLNIFSKAETQGVKVITRSGKVKELTSHPELKDGIIQGETMYNDIAVSMSMAAEKISKLVFEPIPYKDRLQAKQFHLLTSANEWEKVSAIERIYPRKISYSKAGNSLSLNIEIQKANTSALFFYNPEEYKLQYSPDVNGGMKLNKAYQTQVRLDINAGYGYILAEAPDGMNNSQNRYYDELRSGFSLDADLVIYPWKTVGFGARFNNFSTQNSSSADEYLQYEDNINVTFFGGGVSFKTNTQEKDITWGYVDLMAGYMSSKNDFELDNESYSLKGSSIGYYVSPGLKVKLDESFYLSLKAGLLLGGIKKFEVEGDEMELDDADSMARFDAMAGLAVKF